MYDVSDVSNAYEGLYIKVLKPFSVFFVSLSASFKITVVSRTSVVGNRSYLTLWQVYLYGWVPCVPTYRWPFPFGDIWKDEIWHNLQREIYKQFLLSREINDKDGWVRKISVSIKMESLGVVRRCVNWHRQIAGLTRQGEGNGDGPPSLPSPNRGQFVRFRFPIFCNPPNRVFSLLFFSCIQYSTILDLLNY